MSVPEEVTADWPDQGARPAGMLQGAAIVASVVFAAALFGIMTRHMGLLAATWPANALLLALLLRKPTLATGSGWLAAYAGFVAADLVTGSDLPMALWLSLSNLAGVAAGFALFRRLRVDDQRLRRPLSILYLLAISAGAAVAAALVGFGSTPTLLDRGLATGFGYWFASELVNYIVVLPAALTVKRPTWSALRDALRRLHPGAFPFGRWGPLIALIASVIVGDLVGGPGAIAFPMPALLWCALSYSLFSTALLTLLVSMWMMIAIPTGALAVPLSTDLLNSTISVRLGITLMALGPLTAASVNAARNDLVRSLHLAANYDSLTGTLARTAFFARAESLLALLIRERHPVAVLMIDVDSFKQVNDQHGHLAGDRVLAAVAAAIRRSLRDGDLVGRLGGEEFAVILPHLSRPDAAIVAERLRGAVEATGVTMDGSARLGVSVSIGLAAYDIPPGVAIEPLLSFADTALYRAKQEGRNRVVNAIG